jgi:hypothetical protein
VRLKLTGPDGTTYDLANISGNTSVRAVVEAWVALVSDPTIKPGRVAGFILQTYSRL